MVDSADSQLYIDDACRAGLIVENEVFVELKLVEELDAGHDKQVTTGLGHTDQYHFRWVIR